MNQDKLNYYHEVKSRLQDKVLERAKLLVSTSYSFYPPYKRLETPRSQWRNKDYQNLASLIGISTSSLKRLFDQPGYEGQIKFTKRNLDTLADFLDYQDWDELEKKISLEINELS